MIPTGNNRHGITLFDIYQPVAVIDVTAEITLQLVSERFRFANAGHVPVALNILYKAVYAGDGFLIL